MNIFNFLISSIRNKVKDIYVLLEEGRYKNTQLSGITVEP